MFSPNHHIDPNRHVWIFTSFSDEKKLSLKKYISEDYMHTDLGLIHKQILSAAAGQGEKARLVFTVGEFFEPYVSKPFPFHNHYCDE